MRPSTLRTKNSKNDRQTDRPTGNLVRGDRSSINDKSCRIDAPSSANRHARTAPLEIGDVSHAPISLPINVDICQQHISVTRTGSLGPSERNNIKSANEQSALTVDVSHASNVPPNVANKHATGMSWGVQCMEQHQSAYERSVLAPRACVDWSTSVTISRQQWC